MDKLTELQLRKEIVMNTIDTDQHLLEIIKILWETSKERQSIMEQDYDILSSIRKIDTAFQAGRTSAFKEVLDFVTKHSEMQQSKEIQEYKHDKQGRGTSKGEATSV